MATASVVIPPSDIELTLKLSAKEAVVLKCFMQNELHPDEDIEMTRIRQAIWDALARAGVASA